MIYLHNSLLFDGDYVSTCTHGCRLGRRSLNIRLPVTVGQHEVPCSLLTWQKVDTERNEGRIFLQTSKQQRWRRWSHMGREMQEQKLVCCDEVQNSLQYRAATRCALTTIRSHMEGTAFVCLQVKEMMRRVQFLRSVIEWWDVPPGCRVQILIRRRRMNCTQTNMTHSFTKTGIWSSLHHHLPSQTRRKCSSRSLSIRISERKVHKPGSQATTNTPHRLLTTSWMLVGGQQIGTMTPELLPTLLDKSMSRCSNSNDAQEKVLSQRINY